MSIYRYTATMYEHYYDNGDDAPPTIEPAVHCMPSNTYITGFDTMEEAQEKATRLNELETIHDNNKE